MPRVRFWGHALLLCCWLLSATAFAQPRSEAVLRSAREAFRAGTALTRGAQWADALAAYEQSAALHAHATTSYNIAFCERALGRYTRARVAFQRTLDQNDAADAGELSPTLVAKSRGYIVELDSKVGHIQLTLSSPDVAVAVDGRPLAPFGRDGTRIAGTRDAGEAEALGRSRVEVIVDPGPHTLLLILGAKERTQAVGVGAGETVVVDVEPFGDVAPPATPSEHYAAYASWGLGGAGLLTGIIAGAIAIERRSELGDTCPSRSACPEGSQSDIALMQRASDISTAGFVVGGLTAALGTVLFFIPGSNDARVGVTLSPSRFGAAGRF
jgi:hypothetical protein